MKDSYTQIIVIGIVLKGFRCWFLVCDWRMMCTGLLPCTLNTREMLQKCFYSKTLRPKRPKSQWIVDGYLFELMIMPRRLISDWLRIDWPWAFGISYGNWHHNLNGIEWKNTAFKWVLITSFLIFNSLVYFGIRYQFRMWTTMNQAKPG